MTAVKTPTDLQHTLLGIDGKSYPAYQSIKGRYQFPAFELIVDHVQGDPYAAPSRLRARITLDGAGFPTTFWDHTSREIGTRAHLARLFARAAKRASKAIGTGKGGIIGMDSPGQEVLESTAVLVDKNFLEARFTVGLPARGRRILGKAAADVLCRALPEVLAGTLYYPRIDREDLTQAATVNEDADFLRSQLDDRGLTAFVADGAMLPRRTGIDPHPMGSGTVPFQSPAELRAEVDLPHAGRITGLGIPKGVTLIVGGGFHGKSTLLKAIELGVYNHRPSDGRELVVTDSTAVKIRAEDGRSVAGVDVSPFITDLPNNTDTRRFSTQDASGSTSQASNIQEALEAGTRLLLIDEDTSATNFMIRDHRMQELVAKKCEPITPFVDKVRQMWEERGVSTILVMGGSGDYFNVADTVIAMEAYVPRNVTLEALRIAQKYRSERAHEGGERYGPVPVRLPVEASLDPSKGRREVDVRGRGTKTILFGQEEIDLSALEQVVHPGQLRAIGAALVFLKNIAGGNRPLSELLDRVDRAVCEGGLDALIDRPYGDLSGFRRFELASALNRLRTLRVELQ